MTLEAGEGALQASEGALTGASLVIEPFNTAIRTTSENEAWRGSVDGHIEPDADNAFVGPYSGKRVAGDEPIDARAEKWSMPGDGHTRYPGPGDTIRMAVAPQPTDDPRSFVGFAFGKPDDTEVNHELNHSYLCRLDISEYNDDFQLMRDDGGNNIVELAAAEENVTDGDWFVLEAVYDGGGQGVHIGRWYHADWNGPGTGQRTDLIAEIQTPADTTYRGQGVGIEIAGPCYVDELTIIPG